MAPNTKSQPTQASATWSGGERFDSNGSSGHVVPFDADRATNQAPGPMEMVLRSLCACSATDLVIVLGKKRQPFAGIRVSAEAERASEPPQVYTKIHMRYEVSGKGVDREAVQRAVDLSQEKYCSVFAMLRRSATTSYEIVMVEAAP